MSAFAKILVIAPELVMGYHLGKSVAARDYWMDRARQTRFADVRVMNVQTARIHNRQVVRFLRSIRAATARTYAAA